MAVFNKNAMRKRMTMIICICVSVHMSMCVKLNIRKRIVVSSIRLKLRSGISLSHTVDCERHVRVFSPQGLLGVGVKGVGEG